MNVSRGARVVRGEAWKSLDHDGGEGGVGTIVHLQNGVDKAIATVIWDNGTKCTYEVGQQASREILAQDLKQNGETYGKTCCNCTNEAIGSLWSCAVCANVFLCSECYMDDAHDVTHEFRRKAGRSYKWVKLPRRSCSRKITSIGLFPGATVECNKKFGNAFKSLAEFYGRVINYTSDVGNQFSAVSVVWNPKVDQAVYQLGIDGKVEIRCTVYGYGPRYYAEHLPGLVYYQNLENRLRGKTFCQLPLHRSIQYISLDTSYHLPSSDVISPSSDSSEYQFTKVGESSNAGCYRSAAPPMPVAAMRKPVASNSSISQSNATNFMTTNWAGNSSDEVFIWNCLQNGEDESGRMDNLHVKGRTTESRDSCSRSLDSAWLLRTKSSMDCEGAMARRRTDTVPYVFANLSRKSEIGDDVQLKIEVNMLNDLPHWIRDKYIGKVGRLQYIGDDGSCSVKYPCDDQILKLPVDSVIKVDFLEKVNERCHSATQEDSTARKESINVQEEVESINVQEEVDVQLGLRDKVNFERAHQFCGVSCSSNASALQKSRGADVCVLCQEDECSVEFKPCGHQITCTKCSSYFQKCFYCKGEIIFPDSRERMMHNLVCYERGKFYTLEPRKSSLQHIITAIEKLKFKIFAIECGFKCTLCSRNSRSVYFQCGHSTCEPCADNLIICPLCQMKIEVKTIYE